MVFLNTTNLIINTYLYIIIDNSFEEINWILIIPDIYYFF